ncbi:flagellar hook-associated protein FlgK [Nitrosophilus alvini]|uniref:flagellar hook-associated protein FlgK n=1 Tax=Nitrosophilus alvini TaxID=2714855 RepID=UPI00190BCC83|nr:flagellar hook-associated protein FlgK [Nitrosophilus alvini]
MSLFSSLSIGSQALLSFKRGIDITNKNMTNVYTEGYSRVNPVFENVVSGGVYLNRAERIFDNSLFTRTININQQYTGNTAYQDILDQIEFNFNDIQGSGFGTALDEFFNSMNDVIVNPDNLAARQSVISEAKTLVGRIRTSYESLQDTKENTNLLIKDKVQKINELTSKIAKINEGIRAFNADEAKVNEYMDERDRALKELSSLIDTKITFQNDGTVNVSTAKGFDLVLFDKPHTLQFEIDTNADPVIKWEGINITSELGNGEIGGLIKGIDFLNRTMQTLNTFTEEFATAINSQHNSGFDLNGNAGQDMFNFTPGSAASDIEIAFEDPKLIAAASDPAYTNSDNTNIKALLAIKEQNFAALDGLTLNEFYNSKIVAPIGFESSHNQNTLTDNKFLLEAAEQKLQEKSGVNLDEELIKLTQLQRSYEASARIITVTDELLQTVMNMI